MCVLYILELERKVSWNLTRVYGGLFRILGEEVYATWREFHRNAEGHAEGWMWFEGSWEGKRGHLSMALCGRPICVPPHWTIARWRGRLILRKHVSGN